MLSMFVCLNRSRSIYGHCLHRIKMQIGIVLPKIYVIYFSHSIFQSIRVTGQYAHMPIKCIKRTWNTQCLLGFHANEMKTYLFSFQLLLLNAYDRPYVLCWFEPFNAITQQQCRLLLIVASYQLK